MLNKLKFDHGGKKIAVVFLVTVIVYAAIITLISRQNLKGINAIDDALDAGISKKRYNIYEQLIDVNPIKGEATLRILPWPIDEYFGLTFRSGWAPSKDVQFTVDSIIGKSSTNDNLYAFKKDIPTGGFDVTLDQQTAVGNDISKYPFDSYQFEAPVAATYVDEKNITQNLPILPQDYTKGIDTFDVTLRHTLWTDTAKIVSSTKGSIFDEAVKQYSDGNSSSTFVVKRTNSTKLLTFIILLLMVTALSSVLAMSYLVAAVKRAPSLGALTWSAALTFSLIGLRGLFPGSPPIGILIDRIIYFPSLLLTLAASLAILIMWAKRDDHVN